MFQKRITKIVLIALCVQVSSEMNTLIQIQINGKVDDKRKQYKKNSRFYDFKIYFMHNYCYASLFHQHSHFVYCRLITFI